MATGLISESLRCFDNGEFSRSRELSSLFKEKAEVPEDLFYTVSLFVLLLEMAMNRQRDLNSPNGALERTAMNIEISLGWFEAARSRFSRLLGIENLSRQCLVGITASLCNLYELEGSYALAARSARLILREAQSDPNFKAGLPFPGQHFVLGCKNALRRPDCDRVWIELTKLYVSCSWPGDRPAEELKKLLLSRL